MLVKDSFVSLTLQIYSEKVRVHVRKAYDSETMVNLVLIFTEYFRHDDALY